MACLLNIEWLDQLNEYSWNSAVFSATPFSTYMIGVVTSDFMSDEKPWHDSHSDIRNLRLQATSRKRLGKEDCIERYTSNDSGLSSLLIVTSNITMRDQLSLSQTDNTSSLLSNFQSVYHGSDWGLNKAWICSAHTPPLHPSMGCTSNIALSYAPTWTIVDMESAKIHPDKSYWAQVDYCIPSSDVVNMQDRCVLRISSIILSIVCILNSLKCICIAYTLRLHKKLKEASSRTVHLITIGDAIASFLELEDQTTKAFQLVTAKDFAKGWPQSQDTIEVQEKLREYRWFHAAPKRQWIFVLVV